MSLFICMKCGCIENTNCVISYKKEDKDNIDKEYPNMHRMDMDGCGYEDTYVGKVMPYQWKNKDDILYLCSECNTGKWHNEFKKSFPNEIEKAYAKLSKRNFITYSDQRIRYNTFEKLYTSEYHEDYMEMLEELLKTHISEGDIIISNGKLMTEKMLRKKTNNSKIMLSGILGALGIDLESEIDNQIKNKNKYSKQNPKEKAIKITNAKLKRILKQMKKEKDQNKLNLLQAEYDTLKFNLNSQYGTRIADG